MNPPEREGHERHHERDTHGWPLWPPQDPAIFESIRRVWQAGQWGTYRSTFRDECVEKLRNTFQPTAIETDALPEAWRPYHRRIESEVELRLCGSGSSAIELALRGSGVKDGSEFVLAAYDYPGNFRTVELLGGRPVLVDIVPDGTTIDPESLSKIEGDAIAAVIVSHLHGRLADVIAIRQICDARGWMLIEDACQSPGAGWRIGEDNGRADNVDGRIGEDNGRASQSPRVSGVLPVGVLADATTLSFGGSKPLSAGNGGAVLSRSSRLTAKINAFCDRPSDTFPLSPLQAAALIPQLASLPQYNRRRQAMADALTRWDWSVLGGRCLPPPSTDQQPSYYKFPVVAEDAAARDILISRLAEIHMPVGTGFRSTHTTSDRRSRKPVPLENAARLSQRVVLIDHRAMLDDELIEKLDRVASAKA